MFEQRGNLWSYHNEGHWICITTNGFVKKNGECVMGRGCAKEAAERYPELPKLLGQQIKKLGNQLILFPEMRIITFPVKHNWWEEADPDLIRSSCKELVQLVIAGWSDYERVYLPRPGVGNGKLDWDTVVKPILLEEFNGLSSIVVVTW